MGKKIILGMRQAVFLIYANLLELSCTAVSRVYLKWCSKGNASREQQFCVQKYHVDEINRE